MFPYREFSPQTEILPTLPDKTQGIVGMTKDDRGKTVLSVQCETCKVVYTDVMILALSMINHADETKNGYSMPALDYKRCRDCIKSRKYSEREWDNE